jgi:hypothetical protein
MTPFRLLLVLLCCTLAATAKPLDFAGAKDDKEATVRLFQRLELMGMNTRTAGEESIRIKVPNYIICIMPFLSSEGNCLSGYIWFRGKSEANYKSVKLLALVNTINSELTYPTACVNKNGGIEFRYVLPFDRKVDSKTLARWIDSMTSRTDLIMRIHGKSWGSISAKSPSKPPDPKSRSPGLELWNDYWEAARLARSANPTSMRSERGSGDRDVSGRLESPMHCLTANH